MKALILNSGSGTRMGEITKTHPKCMTEISLGETIVGRQLKLLKKVGITDVVMTTGPFEDILIKYCQDLDLGINFTFVNNPLYASTNYIYSIYCAKESLNDDIIMMHGDLIFTEDILREVVESDNSCMVISKTIPLPEKDFKAVIADKTITKVGIEFFENAYAAQPLYKIKLDDWLKWLAKIIEFCENDNRKCYAENAFNEVSDYCHIYGFDIKDRLCMEVDNIDDLNAVKKRLRLELNKK